MAASAAVSSLALGFLCSLPHRSSSSSSRFPPSPSPRKAGRSAIVAFAGPPTGVGGRTRGTPAQNGRNNNGFLHQEDLGYLWKLAVGSIGGATIIKYGSALFPEITRPNILQALLMIGIPVTVSVFLLIKESASDSKC